uniref:Uncharacterized protein n=1 Tax=Arundo donax TaxID=35708 RepID=A0A0A9BRT6_ARUDO
MALKVHILKIFFSCSTYI